MQSERYETRLRLVRIRPKLPGRPSECSATPRSLTTEALVSEIKEDEKAPPMPPGGGGGMGGMY
jgi:hypothetical protein